MVGCQNRCAQADPWKPLTSVLNVDKCGASLHPDVRLARRSEALPPPRSSRGASALLVLQHVQPLLVLGLERHDEVLRGDLAPAVLVHLAREDVVQAWRGHTKQT